MGNNPTMKDVAREAGVALGTVSKVINGIPVGEEYRQKVEAAAKKLGYRVNNYARGLKTNKTNVIAVILPSLIHPFFASIAEFCGRFLKERGYSMIVATTDFDPEAEKKCLDMVAQNKVDGIICLSYNPNLEIDDEIPFVSIDRYFGARVPCVSADNFGGGQLAAQKLTELGCKRILALRAASEVPGEADKRNVGFDMYCQTHDIEHDVLVVYDGRDGWNPFWNYLESHIHEGRLDYDGIFVGTDHLAYHVVNWLREHGLAVPEDVQVIGFDGLRMFGTDRYYLSTIVQPVEQMARSCVELVLSEDKDSCPPLLCLPVSFADCGTTRNTAAERPAGDR